MENEKERINSLNEKSLPNCEIKWKQNKLRRFVHCKSRTVALQIFTKI